MALKQYQTVSAHIKGALVGVMNEQFNSIRMRRINVVNNLYCTHVHPQEFLTDLCLETNKSSQHLKNHFPRHTL